MPSQSADSRFHNPLWFADPEAHAPLLMAPTTDLLAAAPSSSRSGDTGGGGRGGGGAADGVGGASSAAGGARDGRGAPTDPLFPSLLIPAGSALGTVQMPPHPATAAALNHRIAWDRKAAAAATAVDESGMAFNSYLASRSRAVFRALNAPNPHDTPASAGGIVGAMPMFASVRERCNVLVGMGKNSSSASLASSGLHDAMFVRGCWVETGLPATNVQSFGGCGSA